MASQSPLRIYNTFTKKEEEFTALHDRTVKMYTCGPTVYGRPHIGNYASFLMADLVRRWLEVKGYTVEQVKNITDVGHLVADADEGEDKIEKQASQERIDPLDVARKYTEQFLEDEKALNMEGPSARPRATEYIPDMLAMIRALLASGHAYETDDGIYFDVATFPRYGKLSGNVPEDLSAGARVAVNEGKRHPADFALWKKCVGENARHLLRWSFATGERVTTVGEDPSAGFPGWHIECSAMARRLLGERIDLHTGGEDNIFPHHEAEIAQSESCGPAPFARYWLHRRRINFGDVKMSKSLGNILTVPDIVAKGFSPLDLRYYFHSVHYRTNLAFAWKGLEDARKARRSIVEWMGECERMSVVPEHDATANVVDTETWGEQFADAMDDDLNTSAALAVVFECQTWSRRQRFSESSKTVLLTFIDILRRTFGCFEPEDEGVPPEVERLRQERDAARAHKDFAASDRLRDQLQGMGYEVRDTPGGTVVRRA